MTALEARVHVLQLENDVLRTEIASLQAAARGERAPLRAGAGAAAVAPRAAGGAADVASTIIALLANTAPAAAPHAGRRGA